MNNTVLYLILKSLWIILRYIRFATAIQAIEYDATLTMMKVGTYADEIIRKDLAWKDWIES